jgi:hypothetical protein
VGQVKYVVEKGVQIPLCAIVDNNYVDYMTGCIISKKTIIQFINKGLMKKTMNIKNIDLAIYEILGCFSSDGVIETIGYNYKLNGISNYFDKQMRIYPSYDRQKIIDGLLNGKYKQELIWGDEYG